MKKIIFVFVFMSLAVLTACTTGFKVPANLFTTNEDIISFQALAAASLLPTSSEQPLESVGQVELMSFVMNEVEEEETVENDPLLDTIEPYIALVEKFLNSDNGLTVQVGLSDLEDYELMMTFETRGILGEIQTYVIHYNMTLTEEEEDESEFELEGLMIVNGQNYILTGEREVEEGEESIEFTAKLDDLNYVESEYSIESDEIEFEIKVVIDGVVVSETKIEIEYEDDETTIEFDFIEGESKGTYEFKYEMEGNQQVLKIEFDVFINNIRTEGEIVVSVHVDEITGETYYQLFVEPKDGDAYEKDAPRGIDNEDSEESDPSEPEDNESSEPDDSVEE